VFRIDGEPETGGKRGGKLIERRIILKTISQLRSPEPTKIESGTLQVRIFLVFFSRRFQTHGYGVELGRTLGPLQAYDEHLIVRSA